MTRDTSQSDGERKAGAADPARAAPANGPAIFISYRRSDAFETDQLYHHLLTKFDVKGIYIDRHSNLPGEAFPERIKATVRGATVMLVMIGPDWISMQDEATLRRRLEMPDDWVRREIEIALECGKEIIPVLFKGASMPTPAQWPQGLQALGDRQTATLSRDAFYADAVALVKLIGEKLGAERLSRLVKEGGTPYPPEGPYKPLPLDEEHLQSMLRSVPQWRLERSAVSDDPRFEPGYERIELVRDFTFESFPDAIDFMGRAADWIDKFGHHPRWSNVFCTVTVGYCTFEAGHRPTDRDHKSAEALDRIYKEFYQRK